MPLIQLHDISLTHGSKTLADHVSFNIKPKQRICLVGRNGAGKSSLLKLITGEDTPQHGTIHTRDGLHIGFLPQEVPNDWHGSVRQHVHRGLGEVGEAITEYEHAAQQAASDPSNQELTEKLQQLSADIEAEDGWQRLQHADEIITLMNLEPSMEVSTLSGGQSRRVLLAKALAARPEILVLDEPTNHLDLTSIRTLEEVIERRVETLLFVSHDREFVRRVATHIFELDRGQLFEYEGNYDDFVQKRAKRLQDEEKAHAEFDKKLQREEAWMRQGIKARRTRSQGRVRRLEEMRAQRRQRQKQLDTANLQIQEAEASGKKVIEAEHISVSYNNMPSPVVDDFSIKILREDRIGLVGPNGCGKTTLLRALLGDKPHDKGDIEYGTRLKIAYFDQHRNILDEDALVWESVANGSDHVTINGNSRHVLGYLNDFMFPAHRARGPVRVLSGGERNRLLLARLFAKPANVIVLDEPTNDLDFETLELLEARIAQFNGTVLIVSHDREFLNATVTSIVAYRGEGVFEEFVGDYDDYRRTITREQTDAPTERPANNAPKEPVDKQQAQRPRAKKLSNKERKALEELPKRIGALEQEEAELHELLADPALYRDEPERVASINQRLEDIRSEHENAFERWLELEERA